MSGAVFINDLPTVEFVPFEETGLTTDAMFRIVFPSFGGSVSVIMSLHELMALGRSCDNAVRDFLTDADATGRLSPEKQEAEILPLKKSGGSGQ